MARKDGKDRGIVEKPEGSGKWWARLFIDGRELWRRADNKTQAKVLYGRLKAEAREGKLFQKAKPLPFRLLATEYEAVVDANRRGRKGDDRSRIQKWIRAFGDQDSKTITSQQVQRVLNGLLNDEYAPATVHRHLTVLKAILNSRDGLESVLSSIQKNVKRPEYDNELLRLLDHDQEAALLFPLPIRFHPIVNVALHTGLRQGELLRLVWADVNWASGMMYIRQTKNGKSRQAPMNSIVQKVLTELKISQNALPEERVFQHDARYLRRAFERAVQAAGLSPFRFHDLRGAFASRLSALGCNDRTIMELGGWSSPRMLKRYVAIAPAYLWQAIEGLTKDGTGSKTGSGLNVPMVEGSKVLK